MRLIDIDPIIEKLKNAIYLGKRIGEDTANLEAVLADIEAQPTAEKKGRDIFDEVPYHCEFKCSLCGAEIQIIEGCDFEVFNYCPNCGARMEE